MGCPALGQKRTSRQLERMSALPPMADIGTHSRNVRLVPKADMRDEFRPASRVAVPFASLI